LRLDADAARRFATAERDLWFPSINWVGGAGLTPFRQWGIANRTRGGRNAVGVRVIKKIGDFPSLWLYLPLRTSLYTTFTQL
jgi:hypothetical protein